MMTRLTAIGSNNKDKGSCSLNVVATIAMTSCSCQSDPARGFKTQDMAFPLSLGRLLSLELPRLLEAVSRRSAKP